MDMVIEGGAGASESRSVREGPFQGEELERRVAASRSHLDPGMGCQWWKSVIDCKTL